MAVQSAQENWELALGDREAQAGEYEQYEHTPRPDGQQPADALPERRLARGVFFVR
nr:hypothetical protein [Tanacetum cinerariifolium]